MLKKTSGSNCSRISEGGCAAASLRDRARDLAQKGITALMTVVMAVGLMPLPAYAQVSDEPVRTDLTATAFVRSAGEVSAQSDDQSIASTAYAIYDRGTLSFVRSLDATFGAGDSLEGNPLTSISGLIFESGTVYTGFESSGAAPWNTDFVRQGATTVRFIDPIAPSGSCRGWFQGFEVLNSVEHPGNLNVQNVNSLANMFNGCVKLSKLDLSEWDVSSVADAESMFSGCAKLTTLDISGWQLGAVTKQSGASVKMGSMFSGCEALDYLDLYRFDTSKATMDSMFSYCTGLTAVRLGKDFSFYGRAVNYASIPLCGFEPETGVWYRVDGEYADEDAGTEAGSLAADYHKLESDMSGVWKRGSYTGGGVVYAQFDSATATLSFARGETLPSGAYAIDGPYTNDSLPQWHEERAGQIRAVKFNVAVKPASMAYWFADLANLETVDLRALDTSETTSMEGMFKNCSNLREIQGLNLLDTRKVTAMDSLFQGCTSLAALDLSGEHFETGDASMNDVFTGCSGLERVKLGLRFKFNSCQLPALAEASGRSGMWAPVSAYSVRQLSADALALAYPGSSAELAGTWVRGNALTYVVNYYNNGTLVKVDHPSVFKQYDLVDLDGYQSVSGFADAYGWVESADSVGERIASYSARSVDPGTVKNLYSAWSREITVHAGYPATESTLRQYCNNGSSTLAYSASIPADLFEGIDGWNAYGWAESADVIDVPESLRLPSEGDVVAVGYSGSSRDLYAVYARDISFKYDANEKGRGDKIPVSELPSPDTQQQFFRSGDGRPSMVLFSDVSTDLPVMAGYECLGWSMNDSPDEKDIAKELISEDNPASVYRGIEASAATDPVILYAVWSRITYTDTFFANYGDNVSKSRGRAFGTTSEDIVAFTRWGYTQTGWARTSAGDATFEVDYRSQLSTVVGPVRLYAKWVPTGYDITLNLNGGSMDATAGWELNDDGTPKDGSYTVEDDVTLPTTGLSKDGYVFAGWKIAGKPDVAVNGFAKNTYAEDLTFEAMWSECVPAPQPVTGLVYVGKNQVGVQAGKGYELDATENPSVFIDSPTGDALAKDVGSYAVTAKLKSGYVWDNGSYEDKRVTFTISKSAIAKLVVSSATESGKSDPVVEAWVRDGNGMLVKFEDAAIADNFEKAVKTGENGEPIVTLTGKGSGFVDDAKIESTFEVFETGAEAQGRRTETLNDEGGSTIVKVVDASRGSDSLEKLTLVSPRDENGVVTTTEYVGSDMKDDGEGRVASGAESAAVTKATYVGDSLVKTDRVEYRAAAGGMLDTSGAEVKGAQKVSRQTADFDASGNALRVEVVETTFGESGAQTGSTEAVYEGTASDPVKLEGGKLASGQDEKVTSSSESSTRIEGGARITDSFVSTGDGYSKVETRFEGDLEVDGITITTTMTPADENGKSTGASVVTKRVVSQVEDASGQKTTTVSVPGTDEKTEMVRDAEGKVTIVRNGKGTVELSGDILTSITQNGEWFWLDVQGKCVTANGLKEVNDYKGKTLEKDGYASETPDVFNVKLGLVNPTTGTVSTRDSGLSGLRATFVLAGGKEYGNRAFHATHVYSNAPLDIEAPKAESDKVGQYGAVSFTVNRLNEFVIAVEKQVFTVQFDSAKGTAVDAVKVADGSTATAPAAPTRDGYVFDDWYDDSALKTKHDFTKPVTANSKLYAKWKGDLSKATVTLTAKTKSLAYNTKKRVPTISSVKLKDGTAVPKAGYEVSYLKYANKKKTAIAENKVTGVATYYVKLTPKDATSYTGTNDKASFKIVAANNPFTVKAKAKTLSVKAKSGKSFGKAANAFKITNKSKAKLTYSKSKVVKGTANVTKKANGKKITVSKTGVVKVLKGIAPGTYKVTVKVAAAKKGGYKPTAKPVVLTIKVS